ncbi:hypothetical protein BD779DRAFT_1477158 [Infundibulicybe gibba]|nr:hypothetical protein BD779DRAFT_1477158 [Infundibulicybe gibba]
MNSFEYQIYQYMERELTELPRPSVAAVIESHGEAPSSSNKPTSHARVHDALQIAKRKRTRKTMKKEARRDFLEKDRWTKSGTIQTTSVECKACGKTIQLDKRHEYYTGLWEKHRGTCKVIKQLEAVEALWGATGSDVPSKEGRSGAHHQAFGGHILAFTDMDPVPKPCTAPVPEYLWRRGPKRRETLEEVASVLVFLLVSEIPSTLRHRMPVVIHSPPHMALDNSHPTTTVESRKSTRVVQDENQGRFLTGVALHRTNLGNGKLRGLDGVQLATLKFQLALHNLWPPSKTPGPSVLECRMWSKTVSPAPLIEWIPLQDPANNITR